MTLTPVSAVRLSRRWLEFVGDVKPPWLGPPASRASIFVSEPVTLVFQEMRATRLRHEYEYGRPTFTAEVVDVVPDSTREVFVPSLNKANERTMIWVLKGNSWFIADVEITRIVGARRQTFTGQLSYGATGTIGLTGYKYTG